MSLEFNQITAITEKYILPKVADSVFKSNAVLAKFYEKRKFADGGHKITVPIYSSKNQSAEFYIDLDTLSSDRIDDITAASYDWKQAQGWIRLSRLDVLKNSSKQAIVDLLTAKGEKAKKEMKDLIAYGIFSDGTAATGAQTVKQFTGVQGLMSTSATYAGIAVADMAEWVAKIDSASGVDRPLTLDLMQKVFSLCTEDAEKPTMIACRRAVGDQVWSLFQPHQRLMSEGMKKLGFENVLTFNGVPVLIDSHIGADIDGTDNDESNTMYFINEDHLFLKVHRQEDMRKETLERLESSNSMLSRVHIAGNLVCSNRRFQGALKDIEVA